MFLGFVGGLRELFPEGGEEGGPPRFAPGEGRARGKEASIIVVTVESAELDHRSSCLSEGVSGEGSDLPVFESVRKAWPVGFLPAWSAFIIIGVGRMKVN